MRPWVLSGLISLASAAAGAQLPLISADQLKAGASYTWTYYENGGAGPAYSAERYEVLSNTQGKVLIQHSSRMDFRGDTGFVETTRFRVDLRQCENAHRDPRVKMNFSIEIFTPNPDGSYSPPMWLAATAFEEKFNCHGLIRTGRPSPYTTIFAQEDTVRGAAKLFQQKRVPDDQLGSFYFLEDPELKGIAYKKDFNPGTNHHYQMRLTGWSRP